MSVNGQNEDSGARLVLLGTMGGYRMVKMRGAPSQVIVINKQLYLVDCGSGVGRQLAFAGYNLKNLKCLFITHHHSDHNLDYGTVLSLAATEGAEGKVNAYGPSPLEKMVRQFIDWHEYTEGQAPIPVPPARELVDAHDVNEAGPVMEDENVRVSCARVVHPPCENPLAFRFDTEDRSITISGDTSPTPDLIELAGGSDILVHEVYYPPFVEKLSERLPRFKDLVDWFPTAHTTAADAGKIAQEAGVKTLVLSHIVPGDDMAITEEMWKEEASRFFDGEVIVGRDLMTL